MFRAMLATALLVSPALAVAQRGGETGQPPQRIRDVTLQKGEPCPKGTATEVVVCHTLENPYRIPKALRDSGPIPAQNQSWVNKTQTMDDVSRRAAGLPDTCSPVGLGGQSGCALQMNQQWAAEQRAQRHAAADATAPQAGSTTPPQ